MLYKRIVRPILFLMNAEFVHDLAVFWIKVIGRTPFVHKLPQHFLSVNSRLLKQSVDGITYSHPIGLPAGFDKNGQLTRSMSMFGFSFMEVGSVTALPCKGNKKPRLWRIPKHETLVVHYGLKNDGCEKVASRLARHKGCLPVGVNIAQTNTGAPVNLQDSVEDYYASYVKLEPYADYMVVNISCPNATCGQQFLQADNLDVLLTKLDKVVSDKPRYLKLSPDQTLSGINKIINIVKKHNVQGFIVSNLVKDRTKLSIPQKDYSKVGVGGLSGSVTREMSTKVIKHIFEQTKGSYTIIGCGGVFTAEHAYEKMKAGASLVQVYSGFIYNGPTTVYNINKGLIKLLREDGYGSMQEFRESVLNKI